MSTKTGVAPTRAIAPTVAKNVYGVVMTSSPGPMFSAIKQASKASLPDETPTACAQWLYSAIAFSHCSTFGPKMKCWDSITSAMAASTSALIVEYCALRSSSATCILCLLFFQFFVGLGALAQVRWQRCFFIQIEAPQNAGLNFLITVPALRTQHHPVGVGRLESVPMATHPSDPTGWVSDDQCEVGYVLGNHRTGSDERITPNFHS